MIFQSIFWLFFEKLSPMISEASAIVTMPVPRLISLVLLYWPTSAPARPVIAFATQRPTVMVNAGLMEEALTIAGLSPVARIERPSRVLRNHRSARQISASRTARSRSGLQPFHCVDFPIPLIMEKTVGFPKIG